MLTWVVADRVYDYSHAVGGGPLHNVFPIGVAAGPDDIVYVCCRGREAESDVPWNRTGAGAKVSRIRMGPDRGDEELLGELGKYGDGDGQLIWPAGVALDSDGNLYVVDEWMDRVSAFDPESGFLTSWGSSGDGDGEFHRPSGLAIDADDNVLVVDSLNHRVQRLTRDGVFIAKWGGRGDAHGEMDSPWGIDVDSEGYVYVADHLNHRVQKFTADGDAVAVFGERGSGRGQLARPTDVAVDPDGDVYVCDWANDRVQVYAPDGTFITSFIGDAHQLAMWQQATVDANADVVKARRRVYSLEPEWRFAMPTGVAFDAARGRLLVADTQRGRVQIYSKVKDYLEPQFNL